MHNTEEWGNWSENSWKLLYAVYSRIVHLNFDMTSEMVENVNSDKHCYNLHFFFLGGEMYTQHKNMIPENNIDLRSFMAYQFRKSIKFWRNERFVWWLHTCLLWKLLKSIKSSSRTSIQAAPLHPTTATIPHRPQPTWREAVQLKHFTHTSPLTVLQKNSKL